MDVREFNIKKVYSEASGASAVVDENIKMVLNKYGVYEEVINNEDITEVNCLVEKVSPYLNKEINESIIADSLYSEIDGIRYDKKIGYYKSLYVGHVNEGSYRELASSGGMGTWIFKELLERNLIDGVIHVKKNKDMKSKVLFKYSISSTIDEVKEGAKTRYYPVEFSEVINIIKEKPGRYAIIGIPSFIMAIRLLAYYDKIIAQRIKYTIGLVCGHQKSSKFSEAMAWQLGIEPGNLIDIDFRKKIYDRPANNYGIEVTGIKNGKEVTIIKPTKELIGSDWGQGYFKVMASDFSDDVMNETADITLGDAWLPEYIKDSKGNNIVIIRHPEIDKVVKECIKEGKLKLEVVDKETINKSQASHYKHTHDELPYRLYKKDVQRVWRPIKRVQANTKLAFSRKKIQDFRIYISSQSHLQYRKAVELKDFSRFEKSMRKVTRFYRSIYKLNKLKSNLRK